MCCPLKDNHWCCYCEQMLDYSKQFFEQRSNNFLQLSSVKNTSLFQQRIYLNNKWCSLNKRCFENNCCIWGLDYVILARLCLFFCKYEIDNSDSYNNFFFVYNFGASCGVCIVLDKTLSELTIWNVQKDTWVHDSWVFNK